MAKATAPIPDARARLRQFRREMAARRLDAALVTFLPNVRYLSGFTGSNGLILVTQRGATLYTDPRYTIQAKAESAGTGVTVRIAKGPLEPAVALRFSGLKRIGFENHRVSYRSWASLNGLLPLGATLEPLDDVLEFLRTVKSETELAAIRLSVATNSRALDAAIARFRPGMTEMDLAAEIEYQMRLLGAEKPAFDTIVAFGANSARPHARPGTAKLNRNGLLLIDMGTFRGGYASDMTRCFHLGKPGAKTRNHYRAVLEAQLAAVDAIRPGVPANQVDATARKVLAAHGLEHAFVHSTGHGLGLEIHEAPRLGGADTTPLAPGMAITVEPGAYLEGAQGVRVEDTVLVTPSGVEVLTPTTKELITL